MFNNNKGVNSKKILVIKNKDIDVFYKFFVYLRRYFFWLTKCKQKILIISYKNIKSVHFYCKLIKFDYILAESEIKVSKLVSNYREIKKSRKNISSITRAPSTIFLPHNMYNKGFYTMQKCGVFILCALKVENTAGLNFVEPDLFFFCVKTYKLENNKINSFRNRIDMLANFIFLMLFFFIVKIRIEYTSRRVHYRLKNIIKNKKIKQRLNKKAVVGVTFTPTTNLKKITTTDVRNNQKKNAHDERIKNKRLLKIKPLNRSGKNGNLTSKKPALLLKTRQNNRNKILPNFILTNTRRKGPIRTTKKKYNFRRYFKFMRPRNRIKDELIDRRIIRYKKLMVMRFNLNEWIISVLKIKLKRQFYKKFIIVKSPYFAISAKLSGLYKMELQFNFILLRSFIAPNIVTANSLIVNKYILINNTTNSKPLTKLNLMSIVRLPVLIKSTLFLFKPYRFASFFIYRRVLRYLRYKYYFRRFLFKKYYFFKHFNRRTERLTRFIKRKRKKKSIFVTSRNSKQHKYCLAAYAMLLHPLSNYSVANFPPNI